MAVLIPYRGGLIFSEKGAYFPTFLGLGVTPLGKPSKTPVPYDSLEAAKQALDRIVVTERDETGERSGE